MKLIENDRRVDNEDGFNLLIASHKYINRLIGNLPSRLLILTGMSCVGKSHISRRLVARNNDIIHLEIDKIISSAVKISVLKVLDSESDLKAIYHREYEKSKGEVSSYLINSLRDESSKALRPHFPVAFSDDYIEKIVDIVKSIKSFHGDLYHAISTLLHVEIRRIMMSGKGAVLDIVGSQSVLDTFKMYSPRIIMLYATAAELSKNIAHRNSMAVSESKLSEFRFANDVHSQWKMYFKRRRLVDMGHAVLSVDCADFVRNVSNDNALFNTNRFFTGGSSRLSGNEVASTISLKYGNINQMSLALSVDLSLHSQKGNEDSILSFIENILVGSRENLQIYGEIPGKVLIFDGMSMSGKTTIAKVLTKINPSTVFIGRSEGQRKILLDILPETLKKKNTYGEKIFNYSRNHRFQSFREKFPEVEDIDADYLNEINKFCEENAGYVFREEETLAAKVAYEHLEEGRFVVLDNLINKTDLSAFSRCDLVKVLVYCPFSQLITHIRSRMQAATQFNDPRKWRNPYALYQSYTMFYGSQKKFSSSKPLETIFRHDVISTLDTLCNEFNIESYGISRVEYIDDILHRLGLYVAEQSKVYVQLSQPDLVLNTTEEPEKNVIKILSYLAEQSAQDHNLDRRLQNV